MTLNLDSTKAYRRPTDQQILIEAILGAAPSDETTWLEWKSRLDLSKPEGRFSLAKQIIGMANRHPDRVRQYVEGCGYIAVGVEPGTLVDVPEIDPADLEAWLRPYLGQEQPQWTPHRVHVGGNVVLLVIVEPPRWGEPIYCLHRTYQNYPAGTIFVRRLGKTVSPPSPEELAYLQERVGRRADLFQLEVAWIEPAEVSAVDFCVEELQDWVDDQRRELLAPLERSLARKVTRSAEESPERKGISLERLKQVDPGALTMGDVEQLQERERQGKQLSQVEREQLEAATARMRTLSEQVLGSVLGRQGEDRSPDDYRSAVEKYLRKVRDVAFRWQTAVAARSGLVRICPTVTNPTRRNFASVLLDMEIAMSVAAVDAKRAEEAGSDLNLPARPRLWGVARPWNYGITGAILGPARTVSLSHTPDVWPEIEIDNGPPCRVRWRVGDLRPHEADELAPVCLFVAPEQSGCSLEVRWSATAKDAEGMAAGVLHIEVSATPFKVSLAELIQQQDEP